MVCVRLLVNASLSQVHNSVEVPDWLRVEQGVPIVENRKHEITKAKKRFCTTFRKQHKLIARKHVGSWARTARTWSKAQQVEGAH